MIRCLTVLSLLLLAGCRGFGDPEKRFTLETIQKQVLDRHLAGETAAALEDLATRGGRSSKWNNLPDLAAFVRNTKDDRGDELCRKILWEVAEFCNVQFSGDPAAFVRNMRAGELRCQLALALSEKEYLDGIAWKTPAQLEREEILRSELFRLTGNIADNSLSQVKLVYPGKMPEYPLDLFIPVSEDPAEALQIAGVICLLPDEIRRQQLAEENLPLTGLLSEISFLAGSYALHLDKEQLTKAAKKWHHDPSPENLLKYRQWYYRMMLDLSRLPQTRGSKKDRQFITSMLLLQESF